MQTDCFPTTAPEWPKVPVSKLAEVNPRYAAQPGRDYPFVEMASVGEAFAGILRFGRRKLEGSGLARFKAGDTLFAKITPCPENGKVAFVSELPDTLGLGSTEFTVLSPRSGTNARFLYHLLCSHPVRGRAIARMEGSTGRQRVPNDVFASQLLVPMPTPTEQAGIARALDIVDTALARAHEAAIGAGRLVTSVVEDLLARGVGGDGRCRCPAENPADFAVTALGKLPRVWRLSTVGNEFDVQSGFTLNSERRPRLQKRRYLRVANVQRDLLDLSDVQELEANDDEFARRVLAAGDLVVVEGHADSMEIGRCALVTGHAQGMTFQNHLFRLRTKGGVTADFACMWLNSGYAKRFWNARCATSSGLHTVNQRTLKRLSLPVPPPCEQKDIGSIVKQCKGFRDALSRKRAGLQDLKASLMHELLTGGVRVGDMTDVRAP